MMRAVQRVWDEVRFLGPGHQRRIVRRMARLQAEREERAARVRRNGLTHR